MVISTAVMGHPQRLDRGDRLAGALGCPFFCDNGEGLWATASRAFLYGVAQNSDYHAVIQDDAELCANFQMTVAGALWALQGRTIVWRGRAMGAWELPVGLFSMRRKAMNEAHDRGLSWVCSSNGAMGVGLVLPTKMIPGWLAWCEKMIVPEYHSEDGRLAAYCLFNDIPIMLTAPSLVEHADGPSIIGPAPRRKAAWFEEDGVIPAKWSAGLDPACMVCDSPVGPGSFRRLYGKWLTEEYR